jgi:hypothetical protein
MNHFFLPRFSLLRHYSIFCLCKYKFLLHVLLFFILCFIFLWLVWWYIVRQWWYWYFNFRVMNLSFFLSCSIYLYFFIETDIIRPRTRKPHNPNPSKPKDENGQRRVSIYQPRFGMDEHFEPESVHTRLMSTPNFNMHKWNIYFTMIIESNDENIFMHDKKLVSFEP